MFPFLNGSTRNFFSKKWAYTPCIPCTALSIGHTEDRFEGIAVKKCLCLLSVAMMLGACDTPVVTEPAPEPSPVAESPAPTPTPNPTPTPTQAPVPQWQAPEGWEAFQAEGGQMLAIRQRENPSCGERLYCADFEVMPSVSCRNGIYMEVQWFDPNTQAVEDWGNDFLPQLDAGQVGRLSTGIDWPPESFTLSFQCNQ